MRSSVVIKSSKAGMTVILDSQIPFQELLEAIGKKFRESAKFWGAVQMTLTLEGRELTAKEELQIVDTITRNSQVEILCLLDTDARRIERCEKALNDKLMELNSRTGQFYRGTLEKGNVIVLGALRGTAAAGMGGNPEAVVVALEMAPTQIRISDATSRFNDRNRRLGRGAMIASACGDEVQIHSIRKTFLNNMLNLP